MKCEGQGADPIEVHEDQVLFCPNCDHAYCSACRVDGTGFATTCPHCEEEVPNAK